MLIFIMIVSVIVDQVIKIIINTNMNLFESIKIINSFFNITYVKNNGAAWSIMSGNRLLFIIVAIMALIGIYIFFIKNKKLDKLENISYGLLIGGIAGNLIDRIIYGSVIDYLDFNIFGYDFPIFNVADMCIVISVCLLIVSVIRGESKCKSIK